MKTITIGTYMTKLPFTISKEETLQKAQKLMDYVQIRHLPVVENGKLVGMLSERDTHSLQPSAPVAEAFNPEPYFVSKETPLAEVCAVMEQKKFGAAMVVKNNEVVGIFTWIDALRALRELLNRPS